MSIWKYVVLLGGILGVAGFFAPFMEYKAPDGTLTGASAYEIARGEVDVSPLMRKAVELGVGQLGLGIYALFVCGLLGMLGGAGSLVFPDRTA